MSYQPFDLTGRVALVTGAALGIGRALALGLAEAGASVALLDRPACREQAAEVRRAIQAMGRDSRVYELDLLDVAAIRPTIDRVAADFGALDILVNNAGTGISRPALDVTEADWDGILDLNLKALFFCAQAAARHMAARGWGRIVNVASTHALIALPDGAPYIASKGGVASLTRSLALEWIGLGINVNAVAPGPVQTDYKRQADLRLGRTEASIREDMRRRVPLARRLEPEELVGAVIYLASPAAAATVGHVLVVDGGQVIH